MGVIYFINIVINNFVHFPAIIGDVPPTEADKLKIAFAEGYIAANPSSATPNQSRTYRWLRTVQQILAIAVFTAILASLMGIDFICSFEIKLKAKRSLCLNICF